MAASIRIEFFEIRPADAGINVAAIGHRVGDAIDLASVTTATAGDDLIAVPAVLSGHVAVIVNAVSGACLVDIDSAPDATAARGKLVLAGHEVIFFGNAGQKISLAAYG